MQFAKDDTLIPPEFRIERLQLRKDAGSEKKQETPSSTPRPPERRPHPTRPQKVEPKAAEDTAPAQESFPTEGEGAKQPRRRFRKYDRRHRSKQGQAPAAAESAPTEGAPPSPQKEAAPAPIKVDLPKKNNDNVEMRAASPATQAPKKASTRKGWWQKLLD